MWTSNLAELLENPYHTAVSMTEAIDVMQMDFSVVMDATKEDYINKLNAYLKYFGSKTVVIDVEYNTNMRFQIEKNVGVV